MLDGFPHFLIGFLDLAIRTDGAVDHLVGIEDILPHVQESVGVSESEDDEGRVDAEDTLDVFLILFDVVGVERAVSTVTYVAFPVKEVALIVPSDDHGVGQEHLLHVGETAAQNHQGNAQNDSFHFNFNMTDG